MLVRYSIAMLFRHLKQKRQILWQIRSFIFNQCSSINIGVTWSLLSFKVINLAAGGRLDLFYGHTYMHNYPNSLCTWNMLGLHAQLPQFFMYVKRTRPTCTITPILYVRETRLAYTQNYPKVINLAALFWRFCSSCNCCFGRPANKELQ